MLNEGENTNNVKNAFLLQTNMMLSFSYASFPSNTVHNAHFACCFYHALINLNQKKLYILNTRYYFLNISLIAQQYPHFVLDWRLSTKYLPPNCSDFKSVTQFHNQISENQLHAVYSELLTQKKGLMHYEHAI